jgi:hypothetical protein
MNFEKKYWSEGEYKTIAGTDYTGYVGICDGKAYIFNSEEELYGNDTYIARINRSKDNFNRVLSKELKLPHNKNSIQFAANDFLYVSSVKNIIDKLQENNDYIFRNAIISNSVIPYANDCSLLASEDFYECYYYYKSGGVEKLATGKSCYLKGTKIYYKNSNKEVVEAGDAIYVINEYATPEAVDVLEGPNNDNASLTADALYKGIINLNAEVSYRNYKNIPKIKVKVNVNKGIMRKYSFAKKAFSNTTNLDSTLYQQTKEVSNLYSVNIDGSNTENLNKNSSFEVNESEDRKRETTYTPSTTATAKDIWEDLYQHFESPTLNSYGTIIGGHLNKVFEKTYNIDNLYNEEYPRFETTSISNSDEFILEITSNELSSIYSDIMYSENGVASQSLAKFNFTPNSIAFIIKGTVPNRFKINGINHDKKYEYKINNNYKYVIYASSGTTSITDGTIFDFNSAATERNLKIKLPIQVESESSTSVTFMTDANSKIKFALNLRIGTVKSAKVNDYKYIPNITNDTQYQYKWVPKTGGSVLNAPSWMTYSDLTNSVDWLNSEAPKLVTKTTGVDTSRTFVPTAFMTAKDVYHIKRNNEGGYYSSYPDIEEGDETFTNKNETILNHNYSNKIYPIEAPQIVDNTLIRGYKSAKVVQTELKSGYFNKNKFDIIPTLKEELQTIDSEVVPLHNFNDIQSCEVVIRNVEDDSNGKYANLIIFIAFKTKILVLKTKYYFTPEYKNYSINKTRNEVVLENMSNSNKITTYPDLYFNLTSSGKNNVKCGYLEIDSVNYNDEDSLKFINIENIKVHKNMLYVLDGKLNMVLRYDISYLVSPDEDIERSNTFNRKSIKLVDVLHGDGDITDKIYFNRPYCIDVDDDNAYIVDRGNKCVKVYSSALNFIKVLKNGFYASHDIQAVAINPFKSNINGIEIKEKSVWIVSTLKKRIFLSVLEDEIVKFQGQIEDISLIEDRYSWTEEIKGLKFSETNSNYFYLNTNKRIYKFHTSNPLYPFASMSYFKQRSLVGNMIWSSLNYPWNRVPAIYTDVTEDIGFNEEVTWGYEPPTSSAEILDNKCFSLAAYSDDTNKFEGDIIFHYGILYDNNKIRDYIKNNRHKFKNNEMHFSDIPTSVIASYIKSAAMLLYNEPASYISSIANPKMKIYDDSIVANLDNDYINPLTFNKLIYSVAHNLLHIKNMLLGTFKAATNLDNVIVYDNMMLNDYFNNLQLRNNPDYFIHDNEVVSIVANRVFENIFDLQQKIIDNMQTIFMASQSFVNNSSRMI